MLIKEFSSHLLARREQVRLYTEHLKAQYTDRRCYWSSRGLSRMKNGAHICVIIDSMDQGKTSLPRSDLTRAKDLSTLQKPKCHLTAVLVHGWFILMYLSDADLPKNSSVMIEIMSHVLTKLQQQSCCLAQHHLHIQADNTSREMKNNPFLRWMAAMTGSGGDSLLMLVLFSWLRECPARGAARMFFA